MSLEWSRLWTAADLIADIIVALARIGTRPARPAAEVSYLAAATDHADLERRERLLDRHRDHVRGMLPFL
jgi:hypothetical protein